MPMPIPMHPHGHGPGSVLGPGTVPGPGLVLGGATCPCKGHPAQGTYPVTPDHIRAGYGQQPMDMGSPASCRRELRKKDLGLGPLKALLLPSGGMLLARLVTVFWLSLPFLKLKEV